jgi:hypothetical protein
MTGYLLSCPVCDGERDFDTAAEADAAERAQTKALRARAKRMRSDAVLALCETSVWNRLDALAVSEGGTVTIYPAFPLRDGGMGDWTIRYERRDPDSRSRRARYERTFGEGPSRITALYDLCMKVLDVEADGGPAGPWPTDEQENTGAEG